MFTLTASSRLIKQSMHMLGTEAFVYTYRVKVRLGLLSRIVADTTVNT